ncbi:hypothetical protein [Janthinobacterium sp. UMAB-56]|uniref:hypothetical protein n=1 Tax=Janthinobacterium sp. UMAB-56 TaxID=1365361 RepID=UPI001C59DFDE|nr:hypothetical protein [Janthinobacterium sp. UMAB-56]
MLNSNARNLNGRMRARSRRRRPEKEVHHEVAKTTPDRLAPIPAPAALKRDVTAHGSKIG